MIGLEKLTRLKPRFQIKKIAKLLYDGEVLSERYIDAIRMMLSLSEVLIGEDKSKVIAFIDRKEFRDASFFLMDRLGISYGDWDLRDRGSLDPSKRRTFDHYLYLESLRSPFNVGSIFRTAEFFGVKGIYLSRGSASPLHDRAKRTSMGAIDVVPFEEREIDELDLPIFALELGGTPIRDFHFPKRAICLVGSEEDGLSPSLLALASRSEGIVSISGYGAKASLNVASAVSILLEHWAAEES